MNNNLQDNTTDGDQQQVEQNSSLLDLELEVGGEVKGGNASAPVLDAGRIASLQVAHTGRFAQ